MIMVGQVYSYKKIGNFVITNIIEEKNQPYLARRQC